MAICVAAPATPVAVKAIGLPPRPVDVAVKELAPAVAPSVQLPSIAIPEELVATVAPVGDEIEPPPPVTANVTLTPETGFRFASRTRTEGAVPTLWPAVALCPFPPLSAMVDAAPTVPVAVNVT